MISGEKSLKFYNDFVNTGNQTSKKYLINNADWILENFQNKGNYLIYEYDFPFPLFDLPLYWHDGMAQSRSIQVLIKAHQLTNDTKYMDGADLLLNALFVEVKDGGTTYKTNDKGWWYEHYAHIEGNEPRILNGHMAILLGIYEYYEYTNDKDAKFLFDQGIVALTNDLPLYDLNGYSYYDIHKKPASIKYHNYHINLTQKLYEITNEEKIKEFHDKWENCDNFCKMWEKNWANVKRLPESLQPKNFFS